MADRIRISELTETSVIDDASFLAIDYLEETKKVSVGNFNANANATAKRYAEQAAASASDAYDYKEAAASTASEVELKVTDAQGYASDASGYATAASGYADDALGYSQSASGYANSASASADYASADATAADESATLARSWAVGGTSSRTGEDTNNAKYWSDIAASAAAGGVISFNGRSGVVTPQAGDYTAAEVGAAAANDVVNSFNGRKGTVSPASGDYEADDVTATDTNGILGTVGATSDVQAIIDEVTDRVINSLVTNTALQTALGDYVLKSMITELATQTQQKASVLDGREKNPSISGSMAEAIAGKAPTSHASSATTYGEATASNYGHVKLSNNYASSAGAAADGIGASSKAVYDAYTSLNDSLANTNAIFTTDTSTVITNLDNVASSVGYARVARVTLDAAVSPTGAQVSGNIICLGSNANRTLYFMVGATTVANTKIYVNSRYGNTTGWVGWDILMTAGLNCVQEGSVSATIPSGNNRVNSITATIPSGYKWLGWTYCVTSGWVGHVYPSSNTKTSNFFTSNGTASSARDFTAYYLVIRDV